MNWKEFFRVLGPKKEWTKVTDLTFFGIIIGVIHR
jgi:hypothetical protein